MKVLIIYDSMFGNTEKIAQAIAKGFAKTDKVKILRVGEVSLSDLESLDLLIVGSPTQGGRPTISLQEFIKKIPESALKGVKVATFDTRVEAKGAGLRFLTKVLGYAAPRIVDSLKSKGGNLVALPQGFIVEQKEGPLKKGELERATQWSNGIK
ncbi:MAG: flavodoxin family protein [Patescibacteria group bacterium]|jgi:flavodoxin I